MNRCDLAVCGSIDARRYFQVQARSQAVCGPLAWIQAREEWPPWAAMAVIPAPDELPLPFAWHRPPYGEAVPWPGRLLAYWV